MKDTFRQSMAWLHTWTGLLVGWVLFFVFLTGTIGYVSAEVDRWMRPEQSVRPVSQSMSHLLHVGEQRLSTRARNAEFWRIVLPGDPEDRGNNDLSVIWSIRPPGDHEATQFMRETLNPENGQPITNEVRATGGGEVLYRMHYLLHYLPRQWGILIVGVCTMFMLVAILTGIVAHKKIFKDFFTFRPGKGQRSWLDAHNLLGVTTLPFHLMITWSGLVFFLFSYMPVAVDALYPRGEARDQFYAQAYGLDQVDRDATRPTAPLVRLAALLPQVEAEWGAGSVSFVNIDNPGRDNARVTFFWRGLDVDRMARSMQFDGVTGVPLSTSSPTVAGRVSSVLLGLHEGRFAGPLLRVLYVCSGLAGTVMIAAGLLLWSNKRKAKLAKQSGSHLGIVAVDVLNLGTIIGLPIGICAYFWANRLLPLGMDGRAGWEVHVMFIAWGLTFIHAIWRPQARASIELASLAAAAWGLLPVLNVLTTDRHLGVTIPAEDWVLASIDLGMLAAGLFFAFLALTMHRKQTKRGGALMRRAVATPQAELAE